MQIESAEKEIQEMISNGELPEPGSMYHCMAGSDEWSRPVLLLGFYFEDQSRRTPRPRTIVKILEDGEIRSADWLAFSSYWEKC